MINEKLFFEVTLNTRTRITGYIGCHTASMLSFFIGQSNELRINQDLVLNRDTQQRPYSYHFMKNSVRVDVDGSDAMNFLAEIGRHLKV